MRRLHVVSARSWIAKELRPAAESQGLVLSPHLGLDAPTGAENDLWWMPASHASRLMFSGLDLSLQAPASDLLSLLPLEFTRRETLTSTLRDAEFSGSGFCKLADVKTDALMASWFDDSKHFLTKARLLCPPATVVQFTPKFLKMRSEWRFFVSNGEITASSFYLHEGETFYDRPFLEPEGFGEVEAFTRMVVAWLKSNALMPESFVVDVGLTSKGPVVVEFNPSWCAAFYGADLTAVVECLRTSVDGASRFVFSPDPFYHAQASRRPKLKFCDTPTS